MLDVLKSEREEDDHVQLYLAAADAELRQHGLQWGAALYRPVKRVMDYRGFFERAIKYTPALHPEHKAVAEALNVIQDVAKHVNELVGEHVKARKAQLDKIRILKHEVTGDIPMQHLLKHSTYFVTDAVLEMQLYRNRQPSKTTQPPPSPADTPRRSNGPFKAARKVLVSTWAYRKEQKLEYRWGTRRGEYKWYLFSDCLMITRKTYAAAAWDILRCGRGKTSKLVFIGLFDLADCDLEDEGLLEREPSASFDRGSLGRYRSAVMRRMSHAVATVRRKKSSRDGSEASNDPRKMRKSILSAAGDAAGAVGDAAMSTVTAIQEKVQGKESQHTGRLVHRGSTYHLWTHSRDQMVALVAQVAGLKLTPGEGGGITSPGALGARRGSRFSLVRRGSSVGQMRPAHLASPHGLLSISTESLGTSGDVTLLGPNLSATMEVGFPSLAAEMRLLEGEVSELRSQLQQRDGGVAPIPALDFIAAPVAAADEKTIWSPPLKEASEPPPPKLLLSEDTAAAASSCAPIERTESQILDADLAKLESENAEREAALDLSSRPSFMEVMKTPELRASEITTAEGGKDTATPAGSTPGWLRDAEDDVNTPRQPPAPAPPPAPPLCQERSRSCSKKRGRRPSRRRLSLCAAPPF